MPKLYIVEHGQFRLQASGAEAIYARLGVEKMVKRYDAMFPTVEKNEDDKLTDGLTIDQSDGQPQEVLETGQPWLVEIVPQDDE